MLTLPDTLTDDPVRDVHRALGDEGTDLGFVDIADLRVTADGHLVVPLTTRVHRSDRGGMEARAELVKIPDGLAADITLLAFPSGFTGFHRVNHADRGAHTPVTELRINHEPVTGDRLDTLVDEIAEFQDHEFGEAAMEASIAAYREMAKRRRSRTIPAADHRAEA